VAERIGRNFIDLSWSKPRSDGGSKIKGNTPNQLRSEGFMFHIQIETCLLPVESRWMLHIDFISVSDE